jgi:hypothetical protein
MQATAHGGEVGKGAVRLQKAEQAGEDRVLSIHGCIAVFSAKMRQRCEKNNRIPGVRRGYYRKKYFF